MRERFPGPVSTPGVTDWKQSAHGWLKTSGAGTPVIDDSFGVSSITDAGVGLLDVTWAVPFGTAEYTTILTTQDTDGVNSHFYKLSNTTPPTTTAIRLATCNSGNAATDVAGGWHVLVYGV